MCRNGEGCRQGKGRMAKDINVRDGDGKGRVVRNEKWRARRGVEAM